MRLLQTKEARFWSCGQGLESGNRVGVYLVSIVIGKGGLHVLLNICSTEKSVEHPHLVQLKCECPYDESDEKLKTETGKFGRVRNIIKEGEGQSPKGNIASPTHIKHSTGNSPAR